MSKRGGTWVYAISEADVFDDSVYTPCPIKIGVSVNPHWRIREIQAGNSRPLTLLYEAEFGHRDAFRVEMWVHRWLEDLRAGGGTEWFRVSPWGAVLSIAVAAEQLEATPFADGGAMTVYTDIGRAVADDCVRGHRSVLRECRSCSVRENASCAE